MLVITPIVLAVVSAGCFIGLAHSAITTPAAPFLRMTTVMAAVAAALVLIAPAGGAALLGPVLLSRRLVIGRVPDTVAELLHPSSRLATD